MEKRWKHRRLQKRLESTLIRTGQWKAIEKDCDERHEGESKKEFRARLKEAWMVAATLVSMAYEKATPEQQKKMVAAFTEYATNAEREAQDPHFLADMNAKTAEFWMPHRITTYIDVLVTGLNEHFICRRARCLHYTLSTTWIEGSLGHFKCPQCGAFYRPWSSDLTGGEGEKAGGPVVQAQKIMVATSQVAVPEVGMVAGQSRFYLCEWADTKTEILKARLKETFLGIAQESASLGEADLLRTVKDLVNKGPQFGYMTRHEVPQWLKERIGWTNEGGSKEKWDYSHLLNGYMGATGVYEEGVTVILKQEESVRLWAFSKYMLETRVKPRVQKGE